MTHPIPLNALILCPPPDQDELRRSIYLTRLFNLQEYLAALGWNPATDRTRDIRYDLVVLISRVGHPASRAWKESELDGGFAVGFRKGELDWSDIDLFDPATPKSTLRELTTDTWPPSDWKQFKSTRGAGSATGRDYERSKKSGHTAVRAALRGNRSAAPKAALEFRPESRPLLAHFGDRTPRMFPEDRVLSPDGSIYASLTESGLTLFGDDGNQIAHYPDWVSERQLGKNLRVLAVRRQGGAIEMIASTTEDTFSIVTTDRKSWSATRIAEAATAAAVLGERVVLITGTGRTGELRGAAFHPLLANVVASGLDASTVGNTSWLVVWGRDADNGSTDGVAVVLSRRAGRSAWQELARFPSALSAGLERSAPTMPSGSTPGLWRKDATGKLLRQELDAAT